MNKINYELRKEKVATDEILDMVFKDSSVKHGLQEFSKEILKRINGFEKEGGKVRESRGSVQARLNQETLKEIVLPILAESIQGRIADLVHQSHKIRRTAKELLEKAKREVID